MKLMVVAFTLMGFLGFTSIGFAKGMDNNMQDPDVIMLKITSKDVDGLAIKDVDEGDVEMESFSIDRKDIKPGMAKVALKKMKKSLEPGEQIMLNVALVSKGEAQACQVKLTMGKHHKFSKADVEACDVVKSAKIKQKGQTVYLMLQKTS